MAPKVIVYSKPACVQCTATERLLNKYAIPYKKIDISVDTEAYDFVMNSGHAQAPVVVDTTSGESWSGFVPARIKAYVGA